MIELDGIKIENLWVLNGEDLGDPFEEMKNHYITINELIEYGETFDDVSFIDLFSYHYKGIEEEHIIGNEDLEWFDEICKNGASEKDILTERFEKIWEKSVYSIKHIARELWCKEIKLREIHQKRGLEIKDILHPSAFEGISKHSVALLKLLERYHACAFIVSNKFYYKDELIYCYGLLWCSAQGEIEMIDSGEFCQRIIMT